MARKAKKVALAFCGHPKSCITAGGICLGCTILHGGDIEQHKTVTRKAPRFKPDTSSDLRRQFGL